MVNEHHEIPQAAGGVNGPTINICTECHDAVHLCAIKFLAGKKADALAIVNSIFTDKKLANQLIKSAIQYTIKKRDGEIAMEDVEYKINVVLPGTAKKYLQVMAKDMQMGVTKYVTQIVKNMIKKRFPGVKI